MVEKIKQFVKNHRKEIIAVALASAAIVAVTAGAVAVSHFDANLVSTNQISNSRTYSCGPYSVNSHVRQLPVGHTHSLANETKAAASGINLASNQSYIASYLKNIK